MADAVQAFWQHVDEEAADGFVGGERHLLVSIAALDAVILPLEGDGLRVEGDQAAVGDGNAVGVARQIGQHCLRSAKWSLGVDDPLGFAQRRKIGCEGLRISQMGVIAEEAQAAGLVGGDELLQEQTAEQAGHAHGQEESRPARYPALAVGREAAGRHDHVHMRVMGQCRAPGVQHGGDADAGAEMPGVGGNRQHGLSRDLEQQIVDDVGDGRRQREHHAIVRPRQQLGLAVGEPLLRRGALALRAVPVATRVVGDGRIGAIRAARDMAAEFRRAAALDRRHHLQLLEAHMAGIGLTQREPWPRKISTTSNLGRATRLPLRPLARPASKRLMDSHHARHAMTTLIAMPSHPGDGCAGSHFGKPRTPHNRHAQSARRANLTRRAHSVFQNTP